MVYWSSSPETDSSSCPHKRSITLSRKTRHVCSHDTVRLRHSRSLAWNRSDGTAKSRWSCRRKRIVGRGEGDYQRIFRGVAAGGALCFHVEGSRRHCVEWDVYRAGVDLRSVGCAGSAVAGDAHRRSEGRPLHHPPGLAERERTAHRHLLLRAGALVERERCRTGREPALAAGERALCAEGGGSRAPGGT